MGSSNHGDPLAAAAEAAPTQAHPEKKPIQEAAGCGLGQPPPSPDGGAGRPRSFCQAWLLAPLEDARFLICCTNWY